jgi:beta-galactosidase
MDRHPEVYPIDRFGRRKGFGHRDYYTVNAPALWPYVDELVDAMARRYGHHEAIIGWQIDNEIGGASSTLSYGELDRRAFVEWLKDRYSSIDELNDAWGTRFSNQVYTSFDEIIVPTYGAIDLHNPGLELDFRRFSSDAAIAFIARQAEAIRRAAPDSVVTTNFMANFFEIDYYKLASILDVVAIGAYPNCNPVAEHRAGDMAFYHDAAYGYKQMPYWMLEHQSGTPGATTLKPSPQPGDILRWSVQSLARGSQIVLYFRWRTCLTGVEQYWHGILPHSGRPNRRLCEVTQVGKLVENLESTVRRGEERVTSSVPPTHSGIEKKSCDVALILSHENAWVFDIQPHAPGHSYAEHLRTFYRALHERNIACDVVSADSDLSGYRLVIAPNLAIVDTAGQKQALSQRLERFVAEGGALVCDFRSGSRTEDNQMQSSPAPGPLRDLLGIEVLDYGIIESWEERTIGAPSSDDGENEPPTSIGDWFEELELHGAVAHAVYRDGYLSGLPAVTRHSYGEGEVWYISTVIGPEGLRRLLGDICARAGVGAVAALPAGVEVVAGNLGGTDLLVLINHTGEEKRCTCPPGYSAEVASPKVLRPEAEAEVQTAGEGPIERGAATGAGPRGDVEVPGALLLPPRGAAVLVFRGEAAIS